MPVLALYSGNSCSGILVRHFRNPEPHFPG
jgi:hypothetical protein